MGYVNLHVCLWQAGPVVHVLLIKHMHIDSNMVFFIMGPWAQRSIGAWWPYQVGGTPGAALRRVSPRRGAPTFLPPRPLRGVTCHLPPFLPFLPAWLPRLPTSSLSSCLGQLCTWSRLPCCLSRLPLVVAPQLRLSPLLPPRRSPFTSPWLLAFCFPFSPHFVRILSSARVPPTL